METARDSFTCFAIIMWGDSTVSTLGAPPPAHPSGRKRAAAASQTLDIQCDTHVCYSEHRLGIDGKTNFCDMLGPQPFADIVPAARAQGRLMLTLAGGGMGGRAGSTSSGLTLYELPRSFWIIF